jgi:hypothetical protein
MINVEKIIVIIISIIINLFLIGGYLKWIQ